MFFSLADFIADGRGTDFSSLLQSAADHLLALKNQFGSYFKEDYRSFTWVRDPFLCSADELSIDMQEQLIELKSDTGAAVSPFAVPAHSQGGQSPSSLAQHTHLQSEQRGDAPRPPDCKRI
ncbi:unnamed protein product [Pleuronectes platessa]|uniref:Uncharacterized protein n=1 Tax=Pleuronectes platessa TaxID=8262 RepID=A0A9N7YK01_PLEPL|nr:unnamed protein product [Pleuronectes platessa]